MNRDNFLVAGANKDPDRKSCEKAQAKFALIDVKTAAKLIGVSVRTVRHWQAAGLMPPRTKRGHRWKYDSAEVVAFKARREDAISARDMKKLKRAAQIGDA